MGPILHRLEDPSCIQADIDQSTMSILWVWTTTCWDPSGAGISANPGCYTRYIFTDTFSLATGYDSRGQETFCLNEGKTAYNPHALKVMWKNCLRLPRHITLHISSVFMSFYYALSLEFNYKLLSLQAKTFIPPPLSLHCKEKIFTRVLTPSLRKRGPAMEHT